MRGEGFGMPNPEQYRRLLNSFPHSYLSDNPDARKTIPLSLIHVFSCLGRHYGLDIDLVNFPGAVLARVNVEDYSPDGFFLVNMAHVGPDDFIFGAAAAGGDTSPSNSVMMLLRASRNMVASMRQRELGFAFSDAQWAIFCAFTIQLLLSPEDTEPLSLLRATGHLPYMECYTLLMALAPLLDEPRRGPLQSYCERSLMQEDREAITVTPKRRTEVDVKYFIGQVLRHKELEYYGCIIGWDVSDFYLPLS
uniref:Uncharacterized protein UP4 n=1 Tax=Coprinellus disseminatus TaxID=71703 RepID=Q1WMT6_COPDI|nr:conserved hypothetical protein [Coprinellus disseminatus]